MAAHTATAGGGKSTVPKSGAISKGYNFASTWEQVLIFSSFKSIGCSTLGIWSLFSQCRVNRSECCFCSLLVFNHTGSLIMYPPFHLMRLDSDKLICLSEIGFRKRLFLVHFLNQLNVIKPNPVTLSFISTLLT